MEHLGDVGHLDSRFGPFVDSVSLSQDRSTVLTKHTIASEIILDALMELLGDVGHVESPFGHFRDSIRFGV
jgi:hypothetical protein